MKNNTFITIIATLFFAMLSFSCTDLNETIYDKIPEDQFPENDSQAALRIIPVYKQLAELIDDGGWWFWAQEVTSDEIAFPVRLTDWDDGGKWRVLHQHTWDNNTDAINTMWSHLYKGVFEANKAIDELLPFQEEPSARVSIAKIRTLRALYYYMLMDNYGDVPYITSFFTAPDQPFKEDRATIWANLVQDLEMDVPFLSVATNKFAVNKGLGFSLLAKLMLNAEIYTNEEHWQEAVNYCDSIIDLGIYSLEAGALDPFITENENSVENIFTIPFDENNLKGFRIHMRTLHYLSNQTYDMPVGTWNGFAAVEDHYNTFSDNDDRKKGFIVGLQKTSSGQALFDLVAEQNLIINPHIPALVLDGSYTFAEIRLSGARVGKYEIAKGADENLSNDFPIFRYADVLLMKSEALIRLGMNGDDFVNMVRSRAGVSNWSGTTLDMLLEERGREMFCEGHRRQDLIRFGKFNKEWWEKNPSSQDRNTFPIPQWAIDANPNLGM